MSNNIESPANIFELENAVMADLTNFNKEYRLYLTCRVGVSDPKAHPIDYANRDICQGNTNMTDAAVTAAYKRLKNDDNVSGSLDKLTKAITDLCLLYTSPSPRDS